jgi:sporulation protein YlmC with PRC-barrel domain
MHMLVWLFLSTWHAFLLKRRKSCMKRMGMVLGMLAVLSLALTADALAQQQGQPDQGTATSQSPPSSPAAPNNQPGKPGDHRATLSELPGILLSTETLLGSDVKSSQGEGLGKIKHLMVEPRTGRVTYAVVGMGGFLGMGEKSVLVPWHTIEVAHNGNSIVLNVSRQVLQQAPSSAKGKEAEFAEPRWREEVGAHTSYDKQGSGGWGTETPYGRLYNPANEQTIGGQVARIETGAPLPGMAPGMQLLVQMDDAKTTRVHIGPEWYLKRQDVDIPEHTSVQVTGAIAEVEGQPVLLAREVRFDGHVLMLRDAQGMPMWSTLRHSAK